MCIYMGPTSSAMAFNRSEPLSKLNMNTAANDKYLNQQPTPQPRQPEMDMFQSKPAPSDPMVGNWNYDSALDLFSLTPADLDPASFDFADGLTSADTKDLFMDPFGTPSAINGFAMPMAEEAVSPTSEELDSDDQSWPGMPNSIDLSIPESSTCTSRTSKPTTRSSTSQSSSSTRWSSSPDIKAQEYAAPKAEKSTPARKTRSLSQESNQSSTSQDPQVRNAAKRAAHNIIEKRYRTNMNAKFLALEKSISPAGVHKPSRGGAASLKKSEILSNALSYIESIQQENQSMHKELLMLKQNMVPNGMWRHSKSRE